VRIKLVVFDELTDGVAVPEIEPVPVDDRAAAQDEPQRLDVQERELVGGLQPWRECIARWSRRKTRLIGVVLLSQWPGLVVVASPGWGFRSDRVPKKMPNVSPNTASWAPIVPVDARSASGIKASRYQTLSFILKVSTSPSVVRVPSTPRTGLGEVG
jgi:hypothetical protein